VLTNDDRRTTFPDADARPDLGSSAGGDVMGGFFRTVCASAALVSIGVSPPRAAAETPAAGAARPAPTRAVVPLSRLHHVAQREIALGLLAEVAALRPETIRFATALETDFRLLDRRIVAIADAHGIGEDRLRQAYAEDNTATLKGQADDLDRLSMVRGADFDRQFWLTLAHDQGAASTLLASTTGSVPSLDALVAETVRLLDRSIRRARAAQTDSDVPAR
jgi:hypothetical protein